MKGLALFLAALQAPVGEDEVARLAREAFDLARTDEAAALAASERALAAGPDRAEALKAATFVRLRLRDLEGAERFGRRAAEADPGDPYVRVWLGNAAFWRRDLDAAEARYREALARSGGAEAVGDARAKLADERSYRRERRRLVTRALLGGGGAGALLAGALLLAIRAAWKDGRPLGG